MKKTIAKVVALASCAALCLAITGCGGSAQKTELQAFAANSLEKAMPEVQALYSESNDVTFADTQFKASGDLVAELEGGASADVLITASSGTMDTAADGGLINADTRVDMFVNDMIVIGAADSAIKVADDQKLADLLKSDDVKSIAIGDPNVVPAGKYALQCIESAGLVSYETDDEGVIQNIEWDKSIAGKMNSGADKVGTVASYVAEGQCDIGFVYTSDLYRYDGVTTLFTVPADMHKNIIYPGAVCADSKAADQAQGFIEFCMTDPGALEIWQKYGFELAAK